MRCHAWLKNAVWAESPKELGSEGWLWYVENALYGMRESSKGLQDDFKNTFDQWGWCMLKTVLCLAYHPTLDCLCIFHGDDLYTVDGPLALRKFHAHPFSTKCYPFLGSPFPLTSSLSLFFSVLLRLSPALSLSRRPPGVCIPHSRRSSLREPRPLLPVAELLKKRLHRH